jgi:selenocysteine-specific elongation factor
MILGTAGHIDHGKTTLVRALTGVDTDRLPEEKRRGITIDLGFAPLLLDGVGRLGVVDVPGHEAFVRTMVAGATGIDLALLVVAADAGVMPQTREHLSILSLLGVRVGVVALTKRDLVDAEWLELVEEDVRAALAESSLRGAAIVPVSSTSGEGLDALREALAAAARSVPARSSRDLFRLPVDRAFIVKGTGTVVTGTVWSGSLARDANIRLFPSGTLVRVRGLQAHGHAVDLVSAGDRGAVLVQGEGWTPSRVLRADVALLPGSAATLGPRSRVRFHLGTSEVGARLVFRDVDVEQPSRPARVVLDEPLVVRAGDRFVLRAASPVATIGGGIVTDPVAPLRARPWVGVPRDPSAVLGQLLMEAGAAGVDVRELPVRLGAAPDDVRSLLAAVPAWRVGHRLIDSEVRERVTRHALATLDTYHTDHPLEAGAALQWLRSRLEAPDEVAAALLASLADSGELAVRHGLVARRGFSSTLTGAQQRIAEALVELLEVAGQEPPPLEELADRLPSSSEETLAVARWLAREGRLIAIEPSRYFAPSAVTKLHTKLRGGMRAGQDYSPADLKEFLDLTRKFLIPFLEYCDREGYTIRDGLGRRRLGTSGGV